MHKGLRFCRNHVLLEFWLHGCFGTFHSASEGFGKGRGSGFPAPRNFDNVFLRVGQKLRGISGIDGIDSELRLTADTC